MRGIHCFRFSPAAGDQGLLFDMEVVESTVVGGVVEVVFSFGEEYTIRGEKMYILKENDILAIISKE